MIRLIDKMQLVDTVLKKRYSQASINLILNQPEIEAVPIEWLKKYEAKNGQETRLQEALEGWEKENETDRR